MRKFIILISLISFLGINTSFAVTQVGMQLNKETIQKDEEIELSLNLKDVASFTIEMYFDALKLQYVRGPENTNVMENRILYTWVSEDGENKKDLQAGTFVFKGLQEGIATVTASGEFYNSKGEKVEISDNYINIKVESELQDGVVQENNVVQDEVGSQNNVVQDEIAPQHNILQNNQRPAEGNVGADNANLAVLRLNYPRISPEFDKNIKEYYLIIDNTIENLEVVAFAENDEATVIISGNENIKLGKNTINIIVESKDKSKKENYKIYVTKTNNPELANANLETLAIREETLIPEFNANITKYNVEVAYNVDKIQILAIPQSENALVQIHANSEIYENSEANNETNGNSEANNETNGNGETNNETNGNGGIGENDEKSVNIGDNKLEIVVVAQDGITSKKYELNVHRRNEVEEAENVQEQERQVEKLSRILNENEIGNGNIEKILQQENYVWILVFIVIGILIIGSYFVIRGKYKKSKKKTNKEKF